MKSFVVHFCIQAEKQVYRLVLSLLSTAYRRFRKANAFANVQRVTIPTNFSGAVFPWWYRKGEANHCCRTAGQRGLGTSCSITVSTTWNMCMRFKYGWSWPLTPSFNVSLGKLRFARKNSAKLMASDISINSIQCKSWNLETDTPKEWQLGWSNNLVYTSNVETARIGTLKTMAVAYYLFVSA